MSIVFFRIIVAWLSVMRNKCQGGEGGGMVVAFSLRCGLSTELCRAT